MWKCLGQALSFCLVFFVFFLVNFTCPFYILTLKILLGQTLVSTIPVILLLSGTFLFPLVVFTCPFHIGTTIILLGQTLVSNLFIKLLLLVSGIN